jgi:threonine dehydrogenase-like Zn-dependent dehydrogenase
VFGKLGVLRLRDVHLGTRFCAVNCVGFEARGHGKEAIAERPATVLNPVMSVTQTGGRIGIPGLYVTDDPGAVDEAANTATLTTDLPRNSKLPARLAVLRGVRLRIRRGNRPRYDQPSVAPR